MTNKAILVQGNTLFILIIPTPCAHFLSVDLSYMFKLLHLSHRILTHPAAMMESDVRKYFKKTKTLAVKRWTYFKSSE